MSMTKASQRMMFSAEEKMRTLQNYKNGVFKRQVEELQLKQMPTRYRTVFTSSTANRATPSLNTLTTPDKSYFDTTGTGLDESLVRP